jgi:hypothetical protein
MFLNFSKFFFYDKRQVTSLCCKSKLSNVQNKAWQDVNDFVLAVEA